jgi:hypothetical protein
MNTLGLTDQDQGPVTGRGQCSLHRIDHPTDQQERDRCLRFLLYPAGLADAGVDLGEFAIGFHGGGRQLVFLVPVGGGRELAADGRNLGPPVASSVM